MIQITVSNRQSIWDLAIQEYGSVDGVKQLIIDNSTVCNFNDSIKSGTKILIDETKIINSRIVNYLKTKGYKISTADNTNLPRSFNKSFNQSFR